MGKAVGCTRLVAGIGEKGLARDNRLVDCNQVAECSAGKELGRAESLPVQEVRSYLAEGIAEHRMMELAMERTRRAVGADSIHPAGVAGVDIGSSGRTVLHIAEPAEARSLGRAPENHTADIDCRDQTC